ncbi:MAG: hypothetical protein A3I73_02505 [Omnitrophica bacterium RIFCSPLOWO2_02_FULL_45_16]|nr:MAG: hypothetical protein A3I73_02505 [Omnitrophica bacterium RIFCSPLOWO2_02_FULL_45_16]
MADTVYTETTGKNKEFCNKLYKKTRVKRSYFGELKYFLETAGETKDRIVVSIGNGDNEPIFQNQIVSDLSIEGMRNVSSGYKCVVDAHNMPFKKDSVDLVYGWQVAHHLDIDRFFAQLKFVLKEGWRAIFVDNAYFPQWRYLRKLLPKSKVDPKEDLKEECLAKRADEHGFSHFRAKRFNFFAYLINKLMRNMGFDVRLVFLEHLDNFCSGWKIFRDNMRNMVWGFEK